MKKLTDTEKEQLRLQALRQNRLEELYNKNFELNNDLDTLLSNNPNKRMHIILSAFSGACLYCILLIGVVSLLYSSDLSLMFGKFIGWTILFALIPIVLFFPLRKIRKANKALNAQIAACRKEIEAVNQEIITLRDR